MKHLFLISYLFLISISISFSQKKDSTTVIIQNLGANINSQYEELSPIIAPDGKTLYYVRQSHPENKIKCYSTPINGWKTIKNLCLES